MRHWGFVLALVVLSAVSSPAATLVFIATGAAVPGMSALNENPPHPTSSGTGTALITWDTATSMIVTVSVVFSDLTTNTTAAHIHCCIVRQVARWWQQQFVFPGVPDRS